MAKYELLKYVSRPGEYISSKIITFFYENTVGKKANLVRKNSQGQLFR